MSLAQQVAALKAYLCTDWYNGEDTDEDDGSWVLLEPAEGAGTAGPSGSGAVYAEA